MALAGEVPLLFQAPKLHSGLVRSLETRAVTFTLQAIERRGARFFAAALTLARTGIIVIRGAASRQALAALGDMAESTWQDVGMMKPGQELPHLILNPGDQRVVRGYKALVESAKSVVNFRHGEDDGMMDVFHPENLVPALRHLILDCLHEDLVAELAERAFGKPLQVKCRNLYVNKGVQRTRFYHCDGENVKVKSFVYVNDVQSLDIGPYCYVKGSHRDGALRRNNQAFNQQHQFNKHEYRLLRGRRTLPVFCHAGDMVVSAQHGAHRGYPQAQEASRTVLVNVFEPTKKSR